MQNWSKFQFHSMCTVWGLQMKIDTKSFVVIFGHRRFLPLLLAFLVQRFSEHKYTIVDWPLFLSRHTHPINGGSIILYTPIYPSHLTLQDNEFKRFVLHCSTGVLVVRHPYIGGNGGSYVLLLLALPGIGHQRALLIQEAREGERGSGEWREGYSLQCTVYPSSIGLL